MGQKRLNQQTIEAIEEIEKMKIDNVGKVYQSFEEILDEIECEDVGE